MTDANERFPRTEGLRADRGFSGVWHIGTRGPTPKRWEFNGPVVILDAREEAELRRDAATLARLRTAADGATLPGPIRTGDAE